MTSAELVDWINEHYDVDIVGGHVCKRCGMAVNYVTKHGAERHGDPIEVWPTASTHLADPEWVSVW